MPKWLGKTCCDTVLWHGAVTRCCDTLRVCKWWLISKLISVQALFKPCRTFPISTPKLYAWGLGWCKVQIIIASGQVYVTCPQNQSTLPLFNIAIVWHQSCIRQPKLPGNTLKILDMWWLVAGIKSCRLRDWTKAAKAHFYTINRIGDVLMDSSCDFRTRRQSSSQKLQALVRDPRELKLQVSNIN